MQRNRVALRPENAAIAGMPSRTHPYRLALPWAWLLGLFICGTLWGQRAPTPYEASLAIAREHTAKGAHALASDAYRSALALAPDDEARRWCALWDITSHAATLSLRPFSETLNREIEALLLPYDLHGQARDVYWAEVMKLRLDLRTNKSPANRLMGWCEVADFWGRQIDSEAARRGFEESITRLVLLWERREYRSELAATQRALAWMHDTAASANGRVRSLLKVRLAEALELTRTASSDAERIERAHEEAILESQGTPQAVEASLARAWWHNVAIPGGSRRRGGILETHVDYERALREIELAVIQAEAQPKQSLPVSSFEDRLTGLENHLVELKAPRLELVSDPVQHSDTPLVFSVRAFHVPTVTIELIPIDDVTLHALRSQRRHPLATPAAWLRRSPVASWHLSTSIAQGQFGQCTLTRAVNEKLEPGNYLLVARAPSGSLNLMERTGVQLSSLRALALHNQPGEVELHVMDAATGAPVLELNGMIIRNGVPTPFSLGPQDGAQLRLPSPLPSSDETLGLAGTAKGQPFYVPFVPENTRPWVDPPRKVHFVTDRRLYLPGETVRWKLALRTVEQGRLTIPEGLSMTVTATGDGSRTLGTWTGTLNPFGTMSGALALPPHLAPQSVYFDCTPTASPEKRPLPRASIRVDHIRPPEVELKLTIPAERMARAKPGSDLTLDLAARYFSGEAVPGIELELEALFHPLGFGNRQSATDGRPSSTAPVLVTRRLQTDANGSARETLMIPGELDGSCVVQLQARLASNAMAASANLRLIARAAGFTAEVSGPNSALPTTYEFGSGRLASPPLFMPAHQEHRLQLLTRGATDQPASADVRISLQRRIWSDLWQTSDGTVVDLGSHPSGTAPRPSAQLRAGYVDTPIHSQVTSTSSNGHGECALPPLPPGLYELVLSEPSDLEASRPAGRCTLYVADETTRRLPRSPKEPLLVLPRSDRLVTGAPVEVLVVSSRWTPKVWIGLATPSGHQSLIETMEGNSRVFTLPWNHAYLEGLVISAVPLDDSPLLAESRRLAPPDSSGVLDIQLKALPATNRPGASQRVAVRTLDAEGNPVPSEVLIAAVDASLDSLSRQGHSLLVEDLRYVPPIARTGLTSSAMPVSQIVATASAGETLVTIPPRHQLFPIDRTTLERGGIGRGMGGMGSGGSMTPRIRDNFVHTAGWFPEVQTDARGEATVEFTMPDRLTSWRLFAEALDKTQRSGFAQIEAKTSLPLQSRLRLPRAIVAGDMFHALGALVSTATKSQVATASLHLSEADSAFLTRRSPETAEQVVPAKGESVLSWELRALQPGTASLTLEAQTQDESDAMRLPLPILEDGILQPTGTAGRVGEKSLKLSFDLPTPLDPNRSTVQIELAPGVATSVLGALPYLIEYPHGCVEQTMNRFLPAAVAAAWLRDLGLDSKAIDDVLLGKQGTSSWGSQPVTPRLSLDALIQQGLSRLSSAQLFPGGFGWWSQGDPDAFMTGLVLRGLSVTAKTGIIVPPSLMTGTRQTVLASLRSEGRSLGDMDRVWLLSAVLMAGPLSEQERKTVTGNYENLHLTREKLPPAGLALLLQCAHHLARATEVPELVRRLETTAQRNRSRELGELVHWGQSERHFRALEGMIESTALCLEALLLVDPKHPLIDPAADALLINRQSNR